MAIEKFPIEKSHVMMFARSIGDPNKIYYDSQYAKQTECGEIIAPPTFVQSSAQFDPDYFLRPKIGEDTNASVRNISGTNKEKILCLDDDKTGSVFELPGKMFQAS